MILKVLLSLLERSNWRCKIPQYIVKCRECKNSFEKITSYGEIKNFIDKVKCSCGGELIIAPTSSSFNITGASSKNNWEFGPDSEIDCLNRKEKAIGDF